MTRLAIENRALAAMQLNVPVTPAQIAAAANVPVKYVSKYVLYMKLRYGVEIVPVKNGKTVVAYTLMTETLDSRFARAKLPQIVVPEVVVLKNGRDAKGRFVKRAA